MSDDFAVESVAQSFLAPSGVQATGAYDQINDPVSVSTGAPVATAQNTLSGSDKNTPPGPAIFKLNKFDVMWQAYWGTGGFYDGTILRKMTTEVDDQYLLRRAISFYRNFLKQIIDATYKPVFSDGVMRTTKIGEQIDNDGDIAPQWNAFLENVDNRRHGIGSFCKRAVKNARILETCFVIIDNFPNIPADLDVKTAVKNRIFPICISGCRSRSRRAKVSWMISAKFSRSCSRKCRRSMQTRSLDTKPQSRAGKNGQYRILSRYAKTQRPGSLKSCQELNHLTTWGKFR